MWIAWILATWRPSSLGVWIAWILATWRLECFGAVWIAWILATWSPSSLGVWIAWILATWRLSSLRAVLVNTCYLKTWMLWSSVNGMNTCYLKTFMPWSSVTSISTCYATQRPSSVQFPQFELHECLLFQKCSCKVLPWRWPQFNNIPNWEIFFLQSLPDMISINIC